jgi:hypothetical protein
MPKDKGPYIQFVESSPTGLATSRWDILTTDGNDYLLGVIRWFGRWRTYAFFPAAETVFEPTCLRCISDFIEARMDERKEARRSANGGRRES